MAQLIGGPNSFLEPLSDAIGIFFRLRNLPLVYLDWNTEQLFSHLRGAFFIYTLILV